MSQQINLQQNQVDKLILTVGMRQSIKILSLNTIDLNKYLEAISIENPLIRVKNGNSFADNENEDINFNQISNLNAGKNLYDHLIDQISILPISKNEKNDLIKLIYQLNSQGYLKQNSKELENKLNISSIKLAKEIGILQSLDPAGVGARSLSECLFLQAKNDGATKIVLNILQTNFNLLASHKFKRICELYNLTVDEWNQIFDYLKGLTANPAEEYQSEDKINYIIPDAKISIDNNGKFKLWLTKYGQPQLIFAEQTYENLKQSSAENVKEYLKEKRQEYLSLNRSLHQREQTLLTTINQIVLYQHNFFLNRGSMVPMIESDLAKILKVNVSTISRTINGKYLQTDFGIFPLTYFFSKRVNSVNKNRYYSVNEVKEKIKAIINKEIKPLSDSRISKILKTKNIDISRRTVAKYRLEMKIPNTAKRKNLLSLKRFRN